MSRTLERDKYRKTLHAWRQRLDNRLTELRDEAFLGVGASTGDLSNAPIHLADRGSQDAEAVVNFGLAANEAELRREIDDALLRLGDGTFGSCEECRSVIDPERLQALPFARLCIKCAKRSQ